MNDSLKKTPLNQWHRNAGANMADFGGFDMPLWYDTGVKNEHLAVLKSAGLFDTSHMACITVEGAGAFDLINFCFTRDIDSLAPGRCVYGAFLDAKGHCIDDAIVYRFSDTRFMVCVNAGMGGTIAAHLSEQKGDRDAAIADLTAKLAKIDIQGKNAAKILSGFLKDPDATFVPMPYFSFKGDVDPNQPGQIFLADGTPILLSRSGYTGEFGFEIFIAPDKVEALWTGLLEAGKEAGLTACGLGARDSLRAGSCLPLSHQDIGHFPFINHPWDFALPYTEDKSGFTKDFLGAKALEAAADAAEFTYAFVGDSLRKVNAGENTEVLDDAGNAIGRVLTCATDMAVTWSDDKIVSINTEGLSEDVKVKGLACGFVMVNKALPVGSRVTLKEGKRSISVRTIQDIRPDRTARKAIKNFI
ncbi:MAG: aminomethyl transferase family protein [Desulfobacterales bacterium]|nr:aminomethyl transferase family protein [Desulfobacterales bacterium]